MSPEPARSAGWYEDPNELARYRYWNGEQWSVFASEDGLTTTVVPVEGMSIPEPKRIDPRRYVAMVLTMAVLALAILTALWGWWEPSDEFSFGLDSHTGVRAIDGGAR